MFCVFLLLEFVQEDGPEIISPEAHSDSRRPACVEEIVLKRLWPPGSNDPAVDTADQA